MPLNVLLITADDMNYDSPGYAGCRTPDVTPNLDSLAGQGVYFRRAHVTVAICQPSRQVLMTGRYPHRNGAPGFDPIDPAVPTLQAHLRKAGYLNGILGKVNHLAPIQKFCWDYAVDQMCLSKGRDPSAYGRHVREFLSQARATGRPFFLMANSHDPHRPFAGSDQEEEHEAWQKVKYPPARRYYEPGEVAVPGFLPDLPDVRREVAEYFTSVHRCDETVGEILRAVDDSGLADETLVMFLSDNGMAFPFAKTNCYLASTRTPWLARWPGVAAPGRVEDRHFISGIDYMPTILDAADVEPPEGMDGQSFVPLLRGQAQAGRERVFTVINTIASKKSYPMRCVQDRRFGYIFNAWSDGRTVFKNESQVGRTFKAMQAAAEDRPDVAQRVRLFQYRTPEELYALDTDPCCLEDLAGRADHEADLKAMRKRLLEMMDATADPLAATFRQHLAESGAK